jgi:hypothetical protein
MIRRFGLAVGLAAAVAGSTPYAVQELSRQDADSMQRKIEAILSREGVPSRGGEAVQRTAFTEREVNAYFKFLGPEQLPLGVVDPAVAIAEAGGLEGRALVDLDVVRQSKERGWLDPLNYVSGSVEVRASGTLLAANGVGVFKLTSATLGGVAIPKSVLQELVSYYSRTPDHPSGFSLDDPFVLPASIRSIETRRGGATVIQ